MTTGDLSLTYRIMQLYRGGAPVPSFEDVVNGIPVDSDADLADVIEADGRRRIQLGLAVELDRYLDAVPDLAHRPESLDAAIDMTLRGIARRSRVDTDSIEQLVGAHPDLENEIRECAALNNAVWSTGRIRDQFAEWAVRTLPADFGPAMDDGTPRYELTELLGEGAFGQVYLAVDRRLSEDDHAALVSIKILPDIARSTEGRRRLVDEATKARRIDHPNVVRVLDRGVSDQNENFIVYEYVAGGDLGKRVRGRRGGLRAPEAARLTAGLARGVHAAHMAGLVHCDLKPNNIVVTDAAVPKVADFGIAIRTEAMPPGDRPDGERTEPLGNLAFMSPEQYHMEPGALTIPTDVYALGGMLYWLLTGVLPNGSTPEEIRTTHDLAEGRREPPSPRALRPEIDADLDAICTRAMALRAPDRYGSAARLADDLDAWRRREPIAWTQPPISRRLRLWAVRKPGLAIVSCVLALLVLAASGVLWRLAVVAEQRHIADARAEAKEQQRQESGRVFLEHMRKQTEMRSLNLRYELLPDIWLGEWLLGPSVLATNDATRIELWETRTQTVADLVEYARRTGRGDQLQALQWEAALGFWLTVDGDHVNAEPLLAKNLAGWERLLDPDDEWLVQVRAMRACAAVSRLAETPERHVVEAKAPEIVATLDTADALLQEHAPGSPLHRLVLERLMRLYEPDLLDRPDTRARIAQRYATLTE
ncbi:MAG: serine/threonine protein kinase [Planctomycetes bacterium]|nr:serine/threonine protein kinase [Planctomycetota bacterium]